MEKFTKEELIEKILDVYPDHGKDALDKTSIKHLRLILVDELRAKGLYSKYLELFKTC